MNNLFKEILNYLEDGNISKEDIVVVNDMRKKIAVIDADKLVNNFGEKASSLLSLFNLYAGHKPNSRNEAPPVINMSSECVNELHKSS